MCSCVQFLSGGDSSRGVVASLSVCMSDTQLFLCSLLFMKTRNPIWSPRSSFHEQTPNLVMALNGPLL